MVVAGAAQHVAAVKGVHFSMGRALKGDRGFMSRSLLYSSNHSSSYSRSVLFAEGVSVVPAVGEDVT